MFYYFRNSPYNREYNEEDDNTMQIKQDLVDKLILYIGDVEQQRPFFFAEEVTIEGYDPDEVYNHIAILIEGGIIDGFFADDGSSPFYGYLIGGLTVESRYRYHELKKKQKAL